eukprot:5303518-Lingulodinium_polyedra.AAC.1
MGIARKTGKHGSLLINDDFGEYYSLAPFNANAMTALQALHTMEIVLNLLPVPHSNAEWAQAQ